MRKIFVVLAFVIMAFLIYSMVFDDSNENQPLVYDFSFDEIDRDFWLVGQWGDFKRAYDMVTLSDGVLKLNSDNPERTPYMVSKPIEIRQGDLITISRKIKVTHNDEYFAGGMAIFQTDEQSIVPDMTSAGFDMSFGDGIALIEYSYDLSDVQERPGKDVFRFLAADWDYNDNYALINPVYGEWVDEVFVFDTRSSQMMYQLGDKQYKLNSYKLDRNNIRVLMHAYGQGTGNEIAIDQMTITVENKTNP